MKLLALGVDHRSAPTSIREALAFDGPKLAQGGLDTLAESFPGSEFVDPVDLQPGRNLRGRRSRGGAGSRGPDRVPGHLPCPAGRSVRPPPRERPGP